MDIHQFYRDFSFPWNHWIFPYCSLFKVRRIRKKMKEIITKETAACSLKDVVNKLIPDSIAADMMKVTIF